MNRILILTAGFGEGHNAAARALATAVDREAGPGTAAVVDIFAEAAPKFNATARAGYLALINRAPLAWSRFYHWVDQSRIVERRLGLFAREAEVLRRLLERESFGAVCCTFPVCTFLLDQLARRGGPNPPRFNVVTDSISIHSLWWRAPCDGWFLPNEDSADVIIKAGVEPARVHVSGFPVPPFFADRRAELSPPDLATGAAPRVLQIINSGRRNALATARQLLANDHWEVTCAVGRDAALHRQLSAFAANRRRPATILGWTHEIPRLLMTHHVVVSKAGGATTQEAINALCPMIVSQVVPGQEEGNYELLRRHGIGALATTSNQVIDSLHHAFADRGRVWKNWRAALGPIARPYAARDIAQQVLSAIETATVA